MPTVRLEPDTIQAMLQHGVDPRVVDAELTADDLLPEVDLLAPRTVLAVTLCNAPTGLYRTEQCSVIASARVMLYGYPRHVYLLMRPEDRGTYLVHEEYLVLNRGQLEVRTRNTGYAMDDFQAAAADFLDSAGVQE